MRLMLFLSAGLAAFAASGQTKLPVGMLAAPVATAPKVVVYVPSFGVLFVDLDPSTITVDMSSGSPVLRAIAPAPRNVTEVFDVPAGGSLNLTLAHPPLMAQVYRNGLRMRLGADYSLSSSTLTFTAAQGLVSGDSVTVDYTW